MKPLSLRWQMTLWYGAAVAVSLLITGVALILVARHVLAERMDHSLREELREISLELAMSQSETEFQRAANARFFHHDIYEFAIFFPDGRPVFLSAGLQQLKATDVPEKKFTDEIQTLQAQLPVGSRMLLAGWTRSSQFGRVVALSATSLQPVMEEAQRLQSIISVVFPAALVIALSGGYWLSGRALNPVRSLAVAAGSMSIHSMHQRVPVSNPHDEVGSLATTFNALLGRLETAVAEIRRFTADASHEIRTPLAAIRLEAELALSRNRSETDYRQALGVIVDEVSRLGQLADQLLDLSRHDAGLRRTNPEPVRLSDVLQQCVQQMAAFARTRNVPVTLHCEDSLMTTGDPLSLQQAFSNLLENAIKYTNPGGTVSISCRQLHQDLWIDVVDTGIGIEADHIPRLFERFYRVDPSRTLSNGGAGLGLAIARANISACGGEIAISSQPEAGTHVSVRLPALSVQATATVFEHQPFAAPATEQTQDARSIISPDDRGYSESRV